MVLQETQDVTATRLIRLMVVEDYKLTRMGICSLLKNDPQIQIVGEAQNAQEGINIAIAQKPDVVLMDLGLPGTNGIGATQQLKKQNEKIKVIIYTSHEGEEEVIAALGAGADAYCLKDNSPDNLIKTIKMVLDGGAWLDPAIANIAFKIFRQPNLGDDEINGVQAPDVRLSERELEVLTLLVEGKSNAEIAQVLVISPHTAREHVTNILQKLSVHDRVQAAVKAIKDGLV